MIPDTLFDALVDVFPRIARYHASKRGLDADDLMGEMWEVVINKGEGTTHACGRLFDQTPAYIATWAALWVTGSARKALPTVRLTERMTAPPAIGERVPVTGLEEIAHQWQIDLSAALEAIESDELTPALGAYIRALKPTEQRIAALLLSGLKRAHIDRAKLAPRDRTHRIRREMIQVLRAAA